MKIQVHGCLEPAQRATVFFSNFENAIVVPQISVVRRSVGEVIYVVNGDKVKETPVRTGLRQEGYIQILEGIAIEDEIVKDGAGFLRLLNHLKS